MYVQKRSLYGRKATTMAQYPVTHSCGHRETVNLFGKTDEHTRRLAWLERVPCLACKQAAEQTAAETSAADAGLPALTGSEKQITWATRVRAALLGKVAVERERFSAQGRRQGASEEKMASELDKFDAAVAKLAAQTAAAWWIDRRDHGPMALLREVSQ
jgi:hypothetical protein